MTRKSCVLTILGLGLPLMFGFGIMLAYNKDVTGNWLSSPYQVYTDTYTPSHVYGFNNRVRGEKHLGPKVIEHYDRWAENLTPSLAALNTVTRLIASWIWSVDVLPLVMATVVFLLIWRSTERPWLLLFTSILSLHLAHIPYWYVGIMGWHYVFESAPLWCLLLAFVTSRVQQTWSDSHQNYMSWWWCGLLVLSVTGSYVAPGNIWKSKTLRGFHSLLHPRRQQAEFRRWLDASIPQGPALVLVDQQETEASHLDVVSNSPGLSQRILLGRLRPGVTDASKIALDFPSRTVYVCDPTKRSLVRVESRRAQ